MTLIEAMKQALEALEIPTKYVDGCDLALGNRVKAAAALRTAIELAEKQEPVAWMNRHGACKTSLFREVEAGAKDEYTIPLYTTPPAAQRKEAVNAQLLKALEALVDNEDARSWGVFGVDNRSAFTKARAAIKAAKGEKHD